MITSKSEKKDEERTSKEIENMKLPVERQGEREIAEAERKLAE